MSRSLASLTKYMELAFPLSAKETDELKRRVRAAVKDVKAWESGTYSVPDFQEKMRFAKLVLDSNCESWTPKRDAAVQELLDQLIVRLRGFKDSHAQGKRKETLLAWRKEVRAPKARAKDKKDASAESGVAASSRITTKMASSAAPVGAAVESAPAGSSSSSVPPSVSPSAAVPSPAPAPAPVPLQTPSTNTLSPAATPATSMSASSSAQAVPQTPKRALVAKKSKSKKGKKSKKKKGKKVVVAPSKAKKA